MSANPLEGLAATMGGISGELAGLETLLRELLAGLPDDPEPADVELDAVTFIDEWISSRRIKSHRDRPADHVC